MEPPAKRARVGHAPWDDDDEEANDDELSLTATQFEARQDPMYQLDKKRAKSAFKLQSRFEAIFAKYAQDFEGVGDEIDLRTGEVIVDNGHLKSLQDDEDKPEDEDDRDQDEPRKPLGRPARPSLRPSIPARPSLYGGHSLLQDGWQRSQAFNTDAISGPVDPAWQTPELSTAPLQSYPGLGNRGPGYPSQPYPGLSSLFGGQSLDPFDHFKHEPYRRFATAKDVTPKSLLVHVTDEDDDENEWEDQDEEEDEILMGLSSEDRVHNLQTRTVKQLMANPSATSHPPATAKTLDVTGSRAAAGATSTPKRGPGRPRKKPDVSSEIPEHPVPEHLESDLGAGSSTTTDESASEGEDLPGVIPSAASARGDSRLTQQRAVTGVRMQEQTPVTDDSSDSNNRRSARWRKQTEFYSQIKWLKTRQKYDHVDDPAITPPPEPNAVVPKPKTVRSPARENPQPEAAAVPEVPGPKQAGAGVDEQLEDTEARVLVVSGLLDPNSASEDRTVPDSQEPSSSLSRRTVADSQAPSSSLPIPPGLETINTTSGDAGEGATDQTSQISPKTISGDVAGHELLEEARSPEDITEPGIPELTESGNPDDVPNTEVNADADNGSDQEEAEGDISADLSVELGDPSHYEIGSPREVSEVIAEPDSDFAEIPDSEPSSPVAKTTRRPTSPAFKLVEDVETSPSVLRVRPSHRDPLPEGATRLSTTAPEQQPTGPSPEKTPSSSAPKPQRAPHPRISGPRKPSAPASTANPQTPRKQRTSTTTSRPSSGRSAGRLTPSTKRRTLTSLVPDASDESDDDDELSILSSSVARTPTSTASLRARFTRAASHFAFLSGPPPSSAFSTPRRTHRHAHGLLQASSTTTTPRSRTAANAVHSSPLARGVLLGTPSAGRSGRRTGDGDENANGAASPVGSVVSTPGGGTSARRRCGVDGFVCGRDFCFTCSA
ncbi:hypothetical protein JX265_011349 [Neoarthrinium moseri]|uniref:Centromere protein Scm3 n=1 Tax=Neoarthrinium moseri TaxID=1658444 RepID=A0A9P9WCI5_9PEZI|nr:hypothetical protein JX265_011349 [Neoarthrinium moseri]